MTPSEWITEDRQKTGWPPGLLQDDCKALSKWLASKPDARRRVRERCIEIEKEQAMTQEQQPEALRLADGNEECAKAWIEGCDAHKFRLDTAAELRRQHARIIELGSEQDTNAPWLTTAHLLCTDMGIPAGHINDRLLALRELLQSVGAGGVEPLRRGCLVQIQEQEQA